MIFVAGTMTMNPEIIDDFKAEVAAMVDKVRAEDGCMHYSLLVEDANKLAIAMSLLLPIFR